MVEMVRHWGGCMSGKGAAPAQTVEAGAQVEMMSPPGAAMSTALHSSRICHRKCYRTHRD